MPEADTLETPEAEDLSMGGVEEFHDKSDESIDRLFGGVVADDEVDDSSDEEEIQAAEEDVEEEEVEVGEEEAEEAESEESDDADSDEAGEEVENEEDPEGEEVDYDAPVLDDEETETMARKLAKENGRRVKELEAELAEKALEVEALKKDRDEAAEQAASLQVKLDPSSDTEFEEYRVSIRDDVRASEDTLNLPKGTSLQKFPTYMRAYLDAQDGPDANRRDAISMLKQEMTNDFNGSDLAYDDLIEEDRRDVDGLVLEVLKVVQRNAGTARKLERRGKELETRARQGRLEIGAKEYSKSTAPVVEKINQVGKVPDEALEADPHDIGSVVTALAQENPEYAKRLKQAQKDVVTAIYGAKPLTQEEIDTLAANGTDLVSFEKEREKKTEKLREQMAVSLVQALVLRGDFKRDREELFRLRDKKSKRTQEKKALGSLRNPNKANKSGEKKGYVKAMERPNPLDSMFGSSDD